MRDTASHARPRQKVPAAPTSAPRFLALVTLLAAVAALTRPLWGTFSPSAVQVLQPIPSIPVAAVQMPSSSSHPTDTPTPTATTTPSRPLPIGIVAGHSGIQNGIRDPGAVCPDGLEEVEINLEVAQYVVNYLRALGYEVDLLQEYDSRAAGYQGRVLVSIHADSCSPPEASGFKVARAEDSVIPEVEDRLVACLIRRYQTRTGLPFHQWSITRDMTEYHIFREVEPSTPAAIIEVGFMGGDRDLLVNRPDLVAQGIAEGIVCFIEGETP